MKNVTLAAMTYTEYPMNVILRDLKEPATFPARVSDPIERWGIREIPQRSMEFDTRFRNRLIRFTGNFGPLGAPA